MLICYVTLLVLEAFTNTAGFSSAALAHFNEPNLSVKTAILPVSRDAFPHMTAFQFQKRWNKLLRSLNAEGTEWLYITNFDMQSSPKRYVALVKLNSGSLSLNVILTLDEESSQVKSVGILSVWPSDPVDRALLATSCAIALRTVFPQYTQETAVKLVVNQMKSAVNATDNKVETTVKGIPLTLGFSGYAFAFGIGDIE